MNLAPMTNPCALLLLLHEFDLAEHRDSRMRCITGHVFLDHTVQGAHLTKKCIVSNIPCLMRFFR